MHSYAQNSNFTFGLGHDTKKFSFRSDILTITNLMSSQNTNWTYIFLCTIKHSVVLVGTFQTCTMTCMHNSTSLRFSYFKRRLYPFRFRCTASRLCNSHLSIFSFLQIWTSESNMFAFRSSHSGLLVSFS